MEDSGYPDLDSDGEEFFGFNDSSLSSYDGEIRVRNIQMTSNRSEVNIHTRGTRDTFNEDAPLEHSYLGSDLEIISGRVILSDRVHLPLLPRAYGTLIPGQTFPLTVKDRPRKEMLRSCVRNEHTFGCIATSYHQGIHSGVSYGTTAEIYEFSDNSDIVNVKAKARQRFKLLKKKAVDAGYLMGYVEILPEIVLGNPLKEHQALARFRRSRRDWCRKREANLTAWPSWIYDMYDEEKLTKRASTELSFLQQGLKKGMPSDISQLSFWIATHLDADDKMFLISLNSPIQRLRWQLSTMTMSQEYVCTSCGTHIADQRDIFAMTSEGAQATYVNPTGSLHDTLTFRLVTNIQLITTPSTEFSWFPGYAWSIAECAVCHKFVGWEFTGPQEPRQFWGLTRPSLHTNNLCVFSPNHNFHVI